MVACMAVELIPALNTVPLLTESSFTVSTSPRPRDTFDPLRPERPPPALPSIRLYSRWQLLSKRLLYLESPSRSGPVRCWFGKECYWLEQ